MRSPATRGLIGVVDMSVFEPSRVRSEALQQAGACVVPGERVLCALSHDLCVEGLDRIEFERGVDPSPPFADARDGCVFTVSRSRPTSQSNCQEWVLSSNRSTSASAWALPERSVTSCCSSPFSVRPGIARRMRKRARSTFFGANSVRKNPSILAEFALKGSNPRTTRHHRDEARSPLIKCLQMSEHYFKTMRLIVS